MSKSTQSPAFVCDVVFRTPYPNLKYHNKLMELQNLQLQTAIGQCCAQLTSVDPVTKHCVGVVCIIHSCLQRPTL